MKLKIVSEDGFTSNAKLFDADTGRDLSKDLSCTRIECVLQAGEFVQAKMWVVLPGIEIVPKTWEFRVDWRLSIYLWLHRIWIRLKRKLKGR